MRDRGIFHPRVTVCPVEYAVRSEAREHVRAEGQRGGAERRRVGGRDGYVLHLASQTQVPSVSNALS